MWKSIWILGALVFLCAACVSYSELPERVKIQGPVPQNIRSISIQSIPMKRGTLINVDGPIDAPLLLAQSLKEALMRKEPGWKIELEQGQTGPMKGDLIARTEILEVDGGSTGARFWIGFNAGAAQSTVRVSILDGAGRELAVAPISHSTMCPLGWCTDSNEVMIQRNLQSLAEEVAEFVINPSEYEKKKGGR